MSNITRAADALAITIPINTKISGTVDARCYDRFSVQLPAAFTGATISLLVSADGQTFTPLNKNSSDVLWTVTVSQGNAYALPDDLRGWPYFQIQSVSNEAAARTLIVARKS